MTDRLALVTGASSGIGAAFARQLAARAYRLILSARREERLRDLAAELTARHGAAAEVLPADLSQDAGIAAVADRLRQGDVDLLVNNAGFGIGAAFDQADLAGQEAMLAVHVLAPMRLTHAALPPMLARGRGGVINVASLAAFIALPGNANYAATKAYLMRFSRSVHGEVQRRGVTVQALCPGFVRTEFHDDTARVHMERRALPGFLWLPAERVVADSLAALDRGAALVIPGFGYRLFYWALKLGVADALMPYLAPRSRRETYP